MKKTLTLFALFTLFLATIPAFAREGHTGRPGGDIRISSQASREGHTGRPGGGSGVVGGAGSGSGTIIGGHASVGGTILGSSNTGGSVVGVQASSYSHYGSLYWSYQSSWRVFQWFFDLFSFGLFGAF